MKKICLVVLLALHTLLLQAQLKLTVAVAANMQYAMQELVAEFNKTDKTRIDIVPGASGKLTQQIQNGAPFDIFISADKEYPQKLAGNKFTLEPPKVYAQGLLVLWSAKPNIQPSRDLKLLLGANIKSIAIANPKTAPYGSAAEFILKKYALYDKVASKLVTGESISQTSQFIGTRNADIGFTAKSIVIAGAMKGRGNWVELNAADYPPIEQSAALLKFARQNNITTARKFYNFLYSAKAKAIYNKFGYIVK
ncbi:molybdate ABC transporter substrate-binding protein [Niastella populi]|uniref:Molybdate ABC transporter substrate-binding protein n=1 Tax=Niastella populi TaxID=550983 RepID=A0A1V9FKP3_9BACT|nr:molybdate ABC transporter substrate-binding protein [Niastella populi]OQP58918.1 molybdate ABC transporter substrate-binding protein [Niastella populi]